MKRKTIYGLLFLFVAILSTSCSKNGAELLIPQDAVAVFSMNPAKLAQKGGDELSKSFDESSITAAFPPEVSALIQSIVKDPSSTGISLTSDAFFYFTEKDFGLTLELSNEDKFKTIIDKLVAQELFQPIVQKEGISVARLNNRAVLSFDGDRALLKGVFEGDCEDVPAKQFSQKGDDCILANKGYSKLKSKSKDINLWASSKATSIIQKLAYQHQPFHFDNIPLAYNFISLEFVKGEILFASTVYIDDPKSKEQFEQVAKSLSNPNSKYLKRIPQGSFFATNLGVSFAQYLEYFKGIPQFAEMFNEMPKEISDLLLLVDGTITMAIYDKEVLPGFVVFVETNASGTLDLIKNNFGPMFQTVNDKTLSFGNRFFLTEMSDYICITTDLDIALDPEKEAKPSIKEDAYSKVLYESNKINAAIDISKLPMASHVPAVQEFDFAEIRSNTDESELVIHLKDKKKNSFAKLIEISTALMK